MYLANKFVFLAVLLYILKQGDCAMAPEDYPNKGTQEKSSKGKGGAVDEMEEIAQVFSPAVFKGLIKWIQDGKVCLRNGQKAENACYQLDDFQKGRPTGVVNMKEMMSVAKWARDPAKDNSFTKLWYQRLYNTIWFIVAINKATDKARILLAKYDSSENERYTADKGIGNKETSSKAKIDKDEQYGKSTDIDIKGGLEDLPKTVRYVMEWIRDTKG